MKAKSDQWMGWPDIGNSCLYRANVNDSERECISRNADAGDYYRQCVESRREEPKVEMFLFENLVIVQNKKVIFTLKRVKYEHLQDFNMVKVCSRLQTGM